MTDRLYVLTIYHSYITAYTKLLKQLTSAISVKLRYHWRINQTLTTWTCNIQQALYTRVVYRSGPGRSDRLSHFCYASMQALVFPFRIPQILYMYQQFHSLYRGVVSGYYMQISPQPVVYQYERNSNKKVINHRHAMHMLLKVYNIHHNLLQFYVSAM